MCMFRQGEIYENCFDIYHFDIMFHPGILFRGVSVISFTATIFEHP